MTKGKKGIQPEINIGLVGHVDHGKTSLTQALSGKWTDVHSEEIKRGITIKLGYADAIFYEGKDKEGKKSYDVNDKKLKDSKFLRKVSFVDAPGHETLMATMLSGAAIMDGALLLIAANEKCPQAQTKEHLMALEVIGVENIIIVQNKIDLVSEKQALENYKEIKEFVKGTIAEKAPIIPISAQHKINIDVLIQAIQDVIKTPKRNPKEIPLFFIARSFDVNKPGTKLDKLVGGVLGGTLKQGVLKVGDEIEIRPGRLKDKEGGKENTSIFTKITGIKTGSADVKELTPGGSAGILTGLDPYYVKTDSLIGNIIGVKGKLPDVHHELILKPHLLERAVGSKDELVVEALKKGETLMLNVNSAATVGIVNELSKKGVRVNLRIPVCADKKDRVTVSRVLGNRWRLIGWAEIC
jgi:translation initiation factor 2 subunit 3